VKQRRAVHRHELMHLSQMPDDLGLCGNSWTDLTVVLHTRDCKLTISESPQSFKRCILSV